MSYTIWKFPLLLDYMHADTRGEYVEVNMPQGAEPLTVQAQEGRPQLWAKVHPAHRLVPVRIRIATTGDPHGDIGRYLGTVQLRGELVLHFFEEAKP